MCGFNWTLQLSLPAWVPRYKSIEILDGSELLNNSMILFAGEYCEKKIAFCSKEVNPCENGAKCVDHFTHYTCTCLPGFSGDNCSINVDDCLNHMCQVRYILFHPNNSCVLNNFEPLYSL